MSSGTPQQPIASAKHNDASPMRVSLVGESESGVVCAPRGSTPASNDVANAVGLIGAVSAAADRNKAAEVLVTQLSQVFVDANIRCGVGRDRLKRLFDSKLGWLGEESTLFDIASKRWDSLTEDPSYGEPGMAVVSIPQIKGVGRCVVWIDTDSSPVPGWFAESLPALRVVFWDRPTRSWYRLPERLGIGSSAWLSVGLVLALGLAAWPIHYRVACTAVVEPVQQRLISTPFEATLLEAKVRPGDHVKAGEVLVLLDGRPLRLESEGIDAEVQQVSKEHNAALATGRIADAQQAALKKRQLQRRRELLSDRLGRLEVVAPIDGVVVSGDLDQYIGSPLEIGQTIAEIAPLDRMVIELEVPEQEIGFVRSGADTRIRIASAGGRSIRTPIETVYPSAEIRDDASVFVARVEVENKDGKLRPGMQGDATAYGPLRPMSWPWIRGAFEKLLWWSGY